MRTSETLNLAADYLTSHGWRQCALGVNGGPRCVLGGLSSATGDGAVPSVDQASAYAALRRYLNGERPVDWNNQKGRTATEVIEVLRAAALIEAAREDAAKEQTPADAEVTA